jgi:DNA repair ATPase RecN
MKVYKKKQFSQINIFPSNYKNILNRSNSLLNNNKISSNIKNYYNTIYLNNNNNNNNKFNNYKERFKKLRENL